MFAFSNKENDFNISLNSQPGGRMVSPYLSVDPFFDEPDEYITLGQNAPQRGRFELAFNQIGGLISMGCIAGASSGFYNGYKKTANLKGPIRRTQMINYMTKRTVAMSNMMGTVAVMYTGLGCLAYFSRGKVEDNYNTVFAGTSTGALYMCAGGLRKAGIGGLFGLAVGLGLAALNSVDKDGKKFNSSMYY